MYLSQRKTDQAENAFRKAVELAPDLAMVHYELGQLYLWERKLPAAESAFQAALKKDRQKFGCPYGLGPPVGFAGSGRCGEWHYRQAVQLDRHDAVAANNLAASLTEQQEFDDALGLALAAQIWRLRIRPLKIRWGGSITKRTDSRMPIDCSPKLRRRSRSIRPCRYHHAMTLSKIGKQEEALTELKAALSLPGSFPGADRATQMLASNKIED